MQWPLSQLYRNKRVWQSNLCKNIHEYLKQYLLVIWKHCVRCAHVLDKNDKSIPQLMQPVNGKNITKANNRKQQNKQPILYLNIQKVNILRHKLMCKRTQNWILLKASAEASLKRWTVKVIQVQILYNNN